MLKEARPKTLLTIGFHLYKAQEEAKLIYSVRSQNSASFGEERRVNN